MEVKEKIHEALIGQFSTEIFLARFYQNRIFLLQISGFDKIIRKLRPFVILRNMYLIMVLSRKESKKVKTIDPVFINKKYKREIW